MCLQKPSPVLPISPPAAFANAISYEPAGVSRCDRSYGLSPALTSRLLRSLSSHRRHLSS